VRIAIIGSGISGLYAAHQLARHCDLTIFEADSRPGGHSHTVDVAMDGQHLAMDTGFLVFNERNYPHFTALLGSLGVAYQPADMSFSFRCADTGLEYRGDTQFDAIFAQRRNLLRPGHYRMLLDILRFNRLSDQLLAAEPGTSLGDFLARHGFRGPMLDDYLLPMAGAIWSAEPAKILDFPASHFGQFFRNHGLLQTAGRPQWMTVSGRSREYVRAILAPLRDRLLLNTPVEWIHRYPDRVVVKARGRAEASYDQVVLACHSDQALRLLRDPSTAEREILGAVAWQDNEAVLHTDIRLMPRNRRARAAWNYHRSSTQQTGRVSVTYDLTRLQSLPGPREFLLTLNDTGSVDPRTVVERLSYSHPVYTQATIAAQQRHAEINGINRSYYCGAWWGYGFHEDGVRSAIAVADAFTRNTGLVLNLATTSPASTTGKQAVA
jgi:predicted NAD/FAD-binding protein